MTSNFFPINLQGKYWLRLLKKGYNLFGYQINLCVNRWKRIASQVRKSITTPAFSLKYVCAKSLVITVYVLWENIVIYIWVNKTFLRANKILLIKISIAISLLWLHLFSIKHVKPFFISKCFQSTAKCHKHYM
jgi:hypothetical protein